jgi:hypothetical protein
MWRGLTHQLTFGVVLHEKIHKLDHICILESQTEYQKLRKREIKGGENTFKHLRLICTHARERNIYLVAELVRCSVEAQYQGSLSHKAQLETNSLVVR